MSWLGEFEDELATRGIRPAVRERLVTEFADHIACEQGAATAVALTRLGVAREIAGQYADELAADGARHGAFAAFAALGCAAAALVVSQLTLGQFVGYPGFDHGFSAALALPGILAMLVGPQVALVGGTLAAWRAIRRRREPVLPAAEIALLRRRARVGLLAGIVTTTGLLLYTVDFIGVLPAWWLALSGALAAGAMAALVAARRALANSSATVVFASGPAGDLFDDVPVLRRLRGHPLALCVSAAVASGVVVTLAEWHAERSLAEGLQRGIFEAVALSVGFAVLGRTIGARR
jgi:MFS family permease